MNAGPASGLRQYPVLVALECAPAMDQRLLDRPGTEQLLAHYAADLAKLIPGLGSLTLVLAGSRLDPVQILQPDYPVFAALASLLPDLASSDPLANYTPRLLGVGALAGNMPDSRLQPVSGLPGGHLRILPMLAVGPAATAVPLFDAMEHRFLEAGQLSAHSALATEAVFGPGLLHGRFMTITDLLALFRLQLERIGFLPLWELLAAALAHEEQALEVQGQGGQRFRWAAGAVWCQFETFDHWAQQGAGRAWAEADLAGAYADWTREYRQYLLTLAAHGIALHQHLPGQDTQPLVGSFLIEAATPAPAGGAGATEHAAAELGTVAVTVVAAGQLLNFYPLSPAGLSDLHDEIRRLGHDQAGFAWPGCIKVAQGERRLDVESWPTAT